ncbi:MAG TPA: hypothetical protein VLB02_02985 [Candidatus Paceibacterota bacterium]|nr:hypothetical protein [Candidatus Paceibacterota bacterium]
MDTGIVPLTKESSSILCQCCSVPAVGVDSEGKRTCNIPGNHEGNEMVGPIFVKEVPPHTMCTICGKSATLYAGGDTYLCSAAAHEGYDETTLIPLVPTTAE